MGAIELTERPAIAEYLLRDRELNIYHLGDLGDFYWPHTRWFGWQSNGAIEAIALYFTGLSLPTLISVGRGDMISSQKLLRDIKSELPERFYAHLHHEHVEPLLETYRPRERKPCLKMTLHPDVEITPALPVKPSQLLPGDSDELRRFYDSVYPGNWFEPQMLEAGYYYGMRNADELTAAAGVHVVSHQFKVAALGNIATAPQQRGRGLARRLTEFLCRKLREDGIDLIGLNVGRDNDAARATYERIGFKVTAEYEEMLMERVGISDKSDSYTV